LVLFLLALSAVLLMCGIPSKSSSVEETPPPGIMITQGKTPQGFPYLSGGVSSNEREVIDN
jgi:hypothetical protein